MTRDDAVALLEKHLCNIHLIRHSLAAEAVLRGIAVRRGEDADLWGIAGLLHDLDYESTAEDPARHGLVSAEMLDGLLPEVALHAIRAHNAEYTGVQRDNDLDWLLSAGESLTGLIIAVALVYPERKLAPVKPRSVLKRMGMSGFARSVSRERITDCSRAGCELSDLVAVALESMQAIAPALGL
jgi:predicted hydrolase (HD superfamily)